MDDIDFLLSQCILPQDLVGLLPSQLEYLYFHELSHSGLIMCILNTWLTTTKILDAALASDNPCIAFLSVRHPLISSGFLERAIIQSPFEEVRTRAAERLKFLKDTDYKYYKPNGVETTILND